MRFEQIAGLLTARETREVFLCVLLKLKDGDASAYFSILVICLFGCPCICVFSVNGCSSIS